MYVISYKIVKANTKFSLGIKTTIKKWVVFNFTIIMVGSTHIVFTLIKSDS
jgi:hypothetical protein